MKAADAQNLIRMLTHSPSVVSVHAGFAEKVEQMDISKPMLIAIAGESGSGKTFLMEIIQKYLPWATYITTDSYFKDFSNGIKLHGSLDALLAAGYDIQAPFSFHLDILRQNLIDLKEGKDVMIPEHPLDSSGITILEKTPVKASSLIFVDGYSALYDGVRDLFDFVIFLEPELAKQKENFNILLKERGGTEEQSKRVFKILSVSSGIYIKPTRQYADIVLNVFGGNRLDEEKLVREFLSFFIGKPVRVPTLWDKVRKPVGDIKALLDALPPVLKKQVLEEIKKKP